MLLMVTAGFACAAEVCNPPDLIGPYALQLSGTTTISGEPKPATSLSRIVFDGRGKVSGTSSAMFQGLLLGNPVTGTYEVKPDCAIAWKLQDDSGAWQNFRGTISGDLTRGQFRQTDPGGAQSGVLRKISAACSGADLQKQYRFTLSGTAIPMREEGLSRTVSAKGTVAVSELGNVQVDSECIVQFDLLLPAANGRLEGPLRMRGVLVDGGREILAVQTDPGAMVTARFIAIPDNN